jgi:2-phosphosulfolactate phosphatase
MMVDVCFTPDEVVPSELQGRVAVVVDVLRATSTIVTALANGARSIYPVGSIDAAVRLAQNIGRDQVLLCGERRGLPIDGFDLGNSPREFTAERVAGKALVMTTTNGTPALLATTSARSTLVASFLNLGAILAALAAQELPVTVVCAGREKRFSLDDAVCAGAVVLGGAREIEPGRNLPDTAFTAALLARDRLDDLPGLFRGTAAGRQLVDVGLGEDLEYCAQLDRYDIVPRFHDGQISCQ